MIREEAIGILRENLRILSERERRAEEQRQICIDELCRRLAEATDKSPAQLLRALGRSMERPRPEDKAALCLALSGRLSVAKLTGGEENGTAAGAHGRISLVRNRYTEEALEIFSSVLTRAKPSYLSSFSDACEDVMDNRCEFCILPLENTGDGRLFSFYSMLDRYELRICADCLLESEEPSGTVRYALVGHHLPDRLPRGGIEAWRMECSVSAPSESFPEDILRVAPLFGAIPERIDSLPVGYNREQRRFYFTLRLPAENAPALDLYLSEAHHGYMPIGLYPTLTTRQQGAF